jgi:K+-transporting ATPase ATPase A chain
LNKAAVGAVGNPGLHGFTEILYAFTSMTNNNGSAFAGLNGNIPFYNILGGIAMLCGRYLIAIPVLAIAGSLAQKKVQAITVGTLPTHGTLFITLLIFVVVVIGALTFLPALAIGPIAEQLQLIN